MLERALTSPGLCIALHIDDNQDPPPIPIKCVVTKGKCLKPESPKEIVKSWKFPSSKHLQAPTIPTPNYKKMEFLPLQFSTKFIILVHNLLKPVKIQTLGAGNPTSDLRRSCCFQCCSEGQSAAGMISSSFNVLVKNSLLLG